MISHGQYHYTIFQPPFSTNQKSVVIMFSFFYIWCVFSFILALQNLTMMWQVSSSLYLSFSEWTKIFIFKLIFCTEFREISEIISSNIFFFSILSQFSFLDSNLQWLNWLLLPYRSLRQYYSVFQSFFGSSDGIIFINLSSLTLYFLTSNLLLCLFNTFSHCQTLY